MPIFTFKKYFYFMNNDAYLMCVCKGTANYCIQVKDI